MFILILLLFVFTIFAFVITNKVAGKVLLNKGYKEYRLGDYSNWLQNRVKNNKDWNRIRNCLVDDKVCAEFNQKIASETIAQFYQEQLSSIQEPEGTSLVEKVMVVLSSQAGIQEGKDAVVEEGGIASLVEAIEDGSVKWKEFAVLTLLQLCVESVRNRGLLVSEGGIPPLVALSQTGSVRAKHKVETLLGYLR
ncbi:tetraspanin-8-like [Cucumis melo var. makuwa]|uniref:Tetraspanin-8-like n=1 Tax=Cucumis melo var. makuwa TaxID=1194695 RepID=A0A5A7U0Q3_CUCMM|nr:tetraspanin-8-like [Cucumis melo var. makuwa]TYK31544.1 tetraspanin-8-like [Cucumis melo var. makuwa]